MHAKHVFVVCVALLALGLVTRVHPSGRPTVALPYRDAFSLGRAREWQPLGGFWRLHGDTVINGSDAAGSKLVMGSPAWSDYQVTADLRLLAHQGDVGIIVRVSDADVGVNAYRGYYVGLRSRDASLVLGRADYSWLEVRPVPMNERVTTGRWFRLHVVAVGCTIAAEALDLATGVHRVVAMQNDSPQCERTGKIGLRSTDTGSAWKNVSVAAATAANLASLLQGSAVVSRLEYPVQERDLYQLRMQLSGGAYPFSTETGRAEGVPANSAPSESKLSGPLVTTADLRAASSPEERVRVHGITSSIAPFYLQNATGGVRFLPLDPGTLCIGDEVDAVGHSLREAGLPLFVVEHMAPSTHRAPLAVNSISPTQAASGNYEGSLVDVAGKLVSHTLRSDGATVLTLTADGQIFEALLQATPFAAQEPHLQNGSVLRLRGIVTIRAGDLAGSSFLVLLQAGTDVETLSGPSWYEGWRLALLIAGGVVVGCLCAIVALRSARARMKAVLAERERLAHEVHDTLAQSFAGISFQLQGLRKRARANCLLQSSLIEELDEIYEVVSGTHLEASAITAALRPGTLAEGDLLVLIARTAEHLFARHGLEIRTERQGTPRILDPTLNDALFRVALEAIANVLRHSQATAVDLSLQYAAAAVTLCVEDNGIGFCAESVQPSFGLLTVQRRCELVKAQLYIASNPGKGTRLSVVAPHKRRAFSIFGAHRLAG